MGNRLNVNNPFYDGNASASAFGWLFQVDAAIFLFLQYIDEIKEITVEGKYQDIELLLNNDNRIFAQAKSIQNGSSTNRNAKLEDAIISLVKTPYSSNDELLYISNYEAPISRKDLFKNSIVKLKNVEDEKREFKQQIDKIKNKLKDYIDKCTKVSDKNKYTMLLKRIEKIDIDNFLISTIYPYIDTEQPYDRFREIENKISQILTVKFNIQSQHLQKFVRELLVEWHQTFLVDATIKPNKKAKTQSKEELLWQMVAVLSNMDLNIDNLFDEEIDSDQVDEYEMYYTKHSFIHQRFNFFNGLIGDLKDFKKCNAGKNNYDFIKSKWSDYLNEFNEYDGYSDLAKEYLIKKSLLRLINNKNNISKIMEGRNL